MLLFTGTGYLAKQKIESTTLAPSFVLRALRPGWPLVRFQTQKLCRPSACNTDDGARRQSAELTLMAAQAFIESREQLKCPRTSLLPIVFAVAVTTFRSEGHYQEPGSRYPSAHGIKLRSLPAGV